MKTLAIAMTTSNRADVLHDTLAILVPQAMQHGVLIEINDNGSTDHTSEVLRHWSGCYSGLKFKRNATNLGFDLSFSDVMRRAARADYVWSLSDYGLMQDGALSRLMACLEGFDGDLIALNNYRRVQGLPGREYRDAQNFLLDLSWHLTLLDSVIWSSALIRKAEFRRGIGTHFMHLAEIMDQVSTSPSRMLWLDESMMARGHPNKGPSSWLNLAIEVWCGCWPGMVLAAPDATPLKTKHEIIRSVAAKTDLFSVRHLLAFRLNGAANWRSVLGQWKGVSLALPWGTRAMLLGLTLMPRWIVRALADDRVHWRLRMMGQKLRIGGLQ